MSTNRPFVVGASVGIGGRSYQEDRLVCISNLNSFIPTGSTTTSPGAGTGTGTGAGTANDANATTSADSNRSMFACFDGHGGSKASDFLAANSHILLADQRNIKIQPTSAIYSKSIFIS